MGMDVYAFTASPKETPEAKKDRDYNVPGVGDPEGEVPSKWFSGECPSCSSQACIVFWSNSMQGLDKKSLHNFLKQDLDFLLVAVPLT